MVPCYGDITSTATDSRSVTSADTCWTTYLVEHCNHWPRPPKAKPKSWRWYDIFRTWLSLAPRPSRIQEKPRLRKPQARKDIVQHRSWKRRRRLQRLAVAG